jgi:glycosyltransferase involved in cell wall biosynthesis
MTRVMLAAYRVATQPHAAGHFWVYAQYVDALRRLGCDVWWLEELSPKSDPAEDQPRARTLLERLRPLGLADHVILYRTGEGGVEERPPTYMNVSAERAERAMRGADLLLNFHYALSPSLLNRFRRTALIDIDPGILQLWWRHGLLRVHDHDVYFTIGEHLDQPPLNEQHVPWIHTPPAVSLDLWPYRYEPQSTTYTTVASWHSSTYLLVEDGSLYDTNKKHSFLAYVDLPKRTNQQLELALVLSKREESERELLESNGWLLRDASRVAGTPADYQSYIQRSRGEFSCAKPAYVWLRNAWLSDRTVCYLASGKPAVVQDTGPSTYLSDGCGLLRFSTIDEATAALAEVDRDYEGHCRAAREIAETYFSATRVAARLLERALG